MEEVQRRRDAGEFISQKSVAEWAFKVLKLSVMPAQSTVSRLLKTMINREEDASLNPVKKRKTAGTYPEVDRAVLHWVNEMSARGAFISGEIVQNMGVKLLEGINEGLPEGKKFI